MDLMQETILKDIIDRYEESKYPGLLELLFFMILIIDLLLAVWLTFMAPLHIGKMPYLGIIYIIIIPFAYIAPIIVAICIKKTKKHLLFIIYLYLGIRVLYLAFVFVNEIKYRIAEASPNTDEAISSDIITSGLISIAFTLLFSISWMLLVKYSKKIKNHISN
jgi:hypothetical protein